VSGQWTVSAVQYLETQRAAACTAAAQAVAVATAATTKAQEALWRCGAQIGSASTSISASAPSDAVLQQVAITVLEHQATARHPSALFNMQMDMRRRQLLRQHLLQLLRAPRRFQPILIGTTERGTAAAVGVLKLPSRLVAIVKRRPAALRPAKRARTEQGSTDAAELASSPVCLVSHDSVQAQPSMASTSPQRRSRAANTACSGPGSSSTPLPKGLNVQSAPAEAAAGHDATAAGPAWMKENLDSMIASVTEAMQRSSTQEPQVHAPGCELARDWSSVGAELTVDSLGSGGGRYNSHLSNHDAAQGHL
jgi:hypothetical protein